MFTPKIELELPEQVWTALLVFTEMRNEFRIRAALEVVDDKQYFTFSKSTFDPCCHHSTSLLHL